MAENNYIIKKKQKNKKDLPCKALSIPFPRLYKKAPGGIASRVTQRPKGLADWHTKRQHVDWRHL